jgi:hypothetical protein
VVLVFPSIPQKAKSVLTTRLSTALPRHSVFDSGGFAPYFDSVTVYKVIDEAVVLRHRLLFLLSIIDFSSTGQDLAQQLEASHGIRPEELFMHRQSSQRKWPASLGDWNYFFHGYECRFTNARTGQV